MNLQIIRKREKITETRNTLMLRNSGVDPVAANHTRLRLVNQGVHLSHIQVVNRSVENTGSNDKRNFLEINS